MRNTPSVPCRVCSSRTHSIFCELDQDKLGILLNHKGTRIYQKNDIIFNEGEKPSGLFCVFSGLVKIFKTSQEGKELIVRLAKAGDILGYRSFFGGQCYRASAEAVQETTICFIEKEGIERLIQHSPDLLFKLLKKVCVELGDAEQKFQELLEKSVGRRLSYFLEFMVKNSQSKSFELLLKREEIASLIGARPETVSRTLSDWHKKGFIKVKAKAITILDSKQLQ